MDKPTLVPQQLCLFDTLPRRLANSRKLAAIRTAVFCEVQRDVAAGKRNSASYRVFPLLSKRLSKMA